MIRLVLMAFSHEGFKGFLEKVLNMDINPKKIKKAVVAKKDGLVNTIKESQRVLKITEKPDREEYMMAAKVTVAGTVFIGFIGFVFYLVANLVPMFI